MKNVIYPKMGTGFALNAGESAHPNLWRGLVGLWSPEMGLQGDKLRDWSSHGHHATLTGFAFSGATSNYVPGYFGYGLDFDGTNDLADAGQIYEIDAANTQTMTVMFWMRSATSQTNAALMTYDNNSSLSPSVDWYLMLKTNFTIGGFCDNSEINTGYAQTNLTDGKWHHVTVVARQTSVELWVDGTLKSNTTGLTHSSKTFGSSFSLQWSPIENVARYVGTFGETRVYNRDLIASEIIASYNGASPLSLLSLPTVTSPSGDVTVLPTPLDIVSSIESPTIVIDTTIEPTILTIASDIVSPQAVGEFLIVEPTPLDIVSSIESPVVIIDCTVTPTILTITSSIESPFIPQDITVTPDILTISSEIVTSIFMGERLGRTIKRITF